MKKSKDNLKNVTKSQETIVIDCTGMVFGRVASFASMNAMKGKNVVLLNTEKIVITGSKDNIIKEFVWRRNLKNKANPEHSPKFPRVPNFLVKRMMRGMFPWKTFRGKLAYKRVMAYIGVPEQFRSAELAVGPKSTISQFKKKLTILELCKNFGYGH